jgi:hypothetical protein
MVPQRPIRRGLPRVEHNGFYFMYQKGEAFRHGAVTFERIVRVGINEAEGRLEARLKDYGRNVGTPLHGYIHEALASKKGVARGRVSNLEVTNYIVANFRYRKITLPSASVAAFWEKRIIPTIAEHSQQFVSDTWLGKLARFSTGVWNVEYTSWKEFDDNDMEMFAEPVNKSVA